MENSVFYPFDEIVPREMTPGYLSHIIHTSHNTMNFIDVKAGAESPLHRHVNEQYMFVLEGQFELTAGDETRIVDQNNYALIPPNVLHGGKAITDCRILDIFSPVREDFR